MFQIDNSVSYETTICIFVIGSVLQNQIYVRRYKFSKQLKEYYFYLESQRTYIFTDRSSREPFVNTNIDGKLQLDLLKEVVMLSLRNYFFFPAGKIDSIPKKLYKRKFILAAQRISYTLVCIILEVFLLS